MLLGATGNVGGRILHLLVQSPLCNKVVVVTRRNVAALANPKVQQVVVNMDTLEEDLAPYAKGVDVALAAFGVGKGSAKMADEEVRRIGITYSTAFAVCGQGGRRSRTGDDDSGRRRLAVVDHVPPQHRRQGETIGGAQVRLPRALIARP